MTNLGYYNPIHSKSLRKSICLGSLNRAINLKIALIDGLTPKAHEVH